MSWVAEWRELMGVFSIGCLPPLRIRFSLGGKQGGRGQIQLMALSAREGPSCRPEKSRGAWFGNLLQL